MSAAAFRRTQGFLEFETGNRITSWICGLFAGITYVGWILLLILAVDLIVGQGKASFQGDDAGYAHRLVGETLTESAIFEADNSGLLPFVVRSRHSRLAQPLLEGFFLKSDWTHQNETYSIGLLMLGLILGVLRVSLFILQQLTKVSVIAHGLTSLQRAMFRHNLDLGTAVLQPDQAPRSDRLLRDDLPDISTGLEAWLDNIPREPAKIVVLVLLILLLNPWLALAFILMSGLGWLLGTQLMVQFAARRAELMAAARGGQERVLGLANRLRLLKSYAAESYFQEQYEAHLSKYQDDALKRMRYEATIGPMCMFVGMVVLAIAFWLATNNVLSQKMQASCAVGFFAAIVSLYPPIARLIETNRKIRVAGKACMHLCDFLDERPQVVQREGARFLEPLSQGVEFRQLSLNGQRSRKLIDKLSIHIPAKHKVAIICDDDAQARSIAFLLARLVDPSEGEIRIDDQPLFDVSLESLRSQICLVMESDVLFPDTVANNIGCGDHGYSIHQITEAAKVAHAHQFIRRLPHGYECLVGEAGFPLKPGESFRIALARAILRDPPIVVYEEPAGAYDPESTVLLNDTADRFFRGRTVLVLPRRMATVVNCNQILVLRDGKLFASGSHPLLFGSNEYYRRLVYTKFTDWPQAAVNSHALGSRA